LAGSVDSLPADARTRLDRFSHALERVNVDDLPLYAVRPRQPGHERAVETAAVTARELGLDGAIEAARSAVVGYVERQYAAGSLRFSYGFEAGPSQGPADERVRVMRSLSDAISALVLWDRLDPEDQAELLGAWTNLEA
jgi:hypothetical protein